MSIVADTSTFVTVLNNESDAPLYRRFLLGAENVLVSATTAVELRIVVTVRLEAEGTLRLDRLLAQPLFEIVPVDQKLMTLANQGYERYGKGRHPAKLNFGDLFSYALAKSRNLPLLYKGDDFTRTDLIAVIADESR